MSEKSPIDFETDNGTCTVIMKEGKIFRVISMNEDSEVFSVSCDCGAKFHVIMETENELRCCPVCGSGALLDEEDEDYDEEDEDYDEEDEVVD